MRGLLAALFLCLLTVQANTAADGGPDSVRVCDNIGCRYVNGGKSAPAKFGTYTPKGKTKAAAVKQRKNQAQKHTEPVSYGATPWITEARRYTGASGSQLGMKHRLWCGEFLGRVGKATGLKLPRNPNWAADWTESGPRISGPRPGAIALIGRSRIHHVGIVTGVDKHGNPIIISGNHNNRVVETAYPRGSIAAYVWPRTTEQAKLPADATQASLPPHTDGGALVNAVKKVVGISFDKIPSGLRPYAKKMAEAAQDAGVDPVYQLSMAYMESSFSPIKSAWPDSSAYGLCQLLRYERLHVYKIGERPNVDQQVKACALKTKENTNLYRDIFHQEPTVDDLYLVHWQGIGGAVLLKLAKPHEMVEDVLNKWQFYRGHEKDYGTWVVSKNKTLKNMTVAMYLASLKNRSIEAVRLVSM